MVNSNIQKINSNVYKIEYEINMRLIKKSYFPFSFFFFLFSFFFLEGCTKEFSDIEEFSEYINKEDSPFKQTITKEGVKVTVNYMPADVLLIPSYKRLQEINQEIKEKRKKRKEKNDRQLDSLTQNVNYEDLEKKKEKILKDIKDNREIYNRSVYFQLTIGYEDITKDIVYDRMKYGFDQYSDWLHKLAFRLKEYIYLKTGLIEEIPVDTYHMERTFGMTKYRKILIMFPDRFNDINLMDKKNKYLELVMKEFGLGTGKLRFKFELPIEEVSLVIEK